MTRGRPRVVQASLAVNGPYDIAPALETYLIYPWLREADSLVRILRCGPDGTTLIKAEIRQVGSVREPDLQATFRSESALSADTVSEATEALMRCLQLRSNLGDIYKLSTDDNVLRAAMEHRGFGRGKLYPDLFEGVCGVVCAQRIAFQRVYEMMETLARTFGERFRIDGRDYWAFPRPVDFTGRAVEEVKVCGLGFRARYVLGIANAMASHPVPYTEWRHNGEIALRERLLELPGIGPYTANLAIAVVYGRTARPHVDSYVRSVISTLYFKGVEQEEPTVASFIATRWGAASEQVLDLLTTDTERWAAPLGFQLNVRSGARGKR